MIHAPRQQTEHERLEAQHQDDVRARQDERARLDSMEPRWTPNMDERHRIIARLRRIDLARESLVMRRLLYRDIAKDLNAIYEQAARMRRRTTEKLRSIR